MTSPLLPLYVGQGIQITDLFLSTQGLYSLKYAFEVGASGTPSAQRDVAGARYGVDLLIGIDAQGRPDLVRTGWDDIALTTGTGGIRQALTFALLTSPGEIHWRPEYGVGILELVNRRITAELLAEIKNRCERSLEDQADVEEFKIDVTAQPGNGVIEVRQKVRLIGGSPLEVGVRIERI